ncbi:MAG: AMP-binding protein, partial [Rubrobacter sp.]|nr:AMP-binding protein [Rubrobacter sp.]
MDSSPYSRKPWLQRYASYVPAELPLPEKSMIDLFEYSVSRRPDADAVRYFGTAISYADLDRMAEGFASLLSRNGVGQGDRVAVYMQNNPQFLVAQYGAWKRGCIVVPINPMLKARELDYHLRDSGARALVCLESMYCDVAREVVPDTEVELVITTSELDLLSDETPGLLAASEKLEFEETVDLLQGIEGAQAGERAPVSPQDAAYLVYTSGTTGQPKGAVETHSNVAFNAEVYRTWMQISDEDSVLGVAPLFHITGLIGHIALAGLAGIPLVLFHRFDPDEAFHLIEKWRPTMTVGSITVFIALMNAPGSQKRDLSSLAKCYSGGAPIA